MLANQSFLQSFWFLVYCTLNLNNVVHSNVEVTLTPINESENGGLWNHSPANLETTVISDSLTEIPQNLLLFNATFISSSMASIEPAKNNISGAIEITSTEANANKNVADIMSTSRPSPCNENGHNLLLLPDATNCSNYYELCSNNPEASSIKSLTRLVTLNSANIKQCQNGERFDSISLQCVDQNALCGLYECPEPEGFFLDPTNVYAFIHCSHDVPTRINCEPNGTVFNNNSKVCTWKTEKSNELPVELQLLRVFIWLVNTTATDPEASKSTNGWTTEDYIKFGISALIAPLSYLFIIAATYFLICKRFRGYKNHGSSADDSDDFYQRYFRRPTRNTGTIDLHPLSHRRAVQSDICLSTTTTAL